MSDTGSQNDQDDKGQGGPGDDTGQGDSGAQGRSQDQQGDTSGDDKGDATGDIVSRDEFEAMKRRMIAADQRASKLEQEKQEAVRKDQTELQNAQQDLKKAQEENTRLLELINSTALETAFVKYGKHNWVDVDDALRLLDREGVEIKDGEVSGLGPAIEKLAKNKPHLVKDKDSDQNDSSGASGSAGNGKRKGDNSGKKPDYSSRFPALKK